MQDNIIWIVGAVVLYFLFRKEPKTETVTEQLGGLTVIVNRPEGSTAMSGIIKQIQDLNKGKGL